MLVVPPGLAFRAPHRAFEDGQSEFHALVIALGVHGAASLLKRPAFLDGQLGAGEQWIRHPRTIGLAEAGCYYLGYSLAAQEA